MQVGDDLKSGDRGLLLPFVSWLYTISARETGPANSFYFIRSLRLPWELLNLLIAVDESGVA